MHISVLSNYNTVTLLGGVNLNSFFSLVNKEWIQFRTFIVTALLTSFALNIGIPIVFNVMASQPFEMLEVVFIFTIFGLAFLFIAACYQLIRSLTLDIRQKELWLHKPASMYSLVGAKLFFTTVWLAIAIIIYTTTLQFLNPLLAGVGNILFLQICIGYFEVSFYLLIAVVLLLSVAFHKYIQRFVKGFAWIFSMLFAIAIVVLIAEICTADSIMSVTISFSFLDNLLPKVNSQSLVVDGTGFMDISILSDLISWIFVIIGFIVASKWLEKVITR